MPYVFLHETAACPRRQGLTGIVTEGLFRTNSGPASYRIASINTRSPPLPVAQSLCLELPGPVDHHLTSRSEIPVWFYPRSHATAYLTMAFSAPAPNQLLD